MCIRDRQRPGAALQRVQAHHQVVVTHEQEAGAMVGRLAQLCLLYTSDAADERSSVDLGGRRIIKKKKRDTECESGELQKPRT